MHLKGHRLESTVYDFAEEVVLRPEAIKPPVGVKFDCLWDAFPKFRPILTWAISLPYERMVQVVIDCYSVAIVSDRNFKIYVQQEGVLAVLTAMRASHFRAIALPDVQAIIRSYCYIGVQPFTEAPLLSSSLSDSDIDSLIQRHNVPAAFLTVSHKSLTKDQVLSLRQAFAKADQLVALYDTNAPCLHLRLDAFDVRCCPWRLTQDHPSMVQMVEALQDFVLLPQ